MGTLHVTISVDKDVGICIEKELVSGTTIAELKEELARDDATGRTRTQDFVLATASDTARALEDHVHISAQLTDLVVLTAPKPTRALRAQLAITSEVVEYRVLQRKLVKKLGADPAGEKAVKLTRQVGSIMFTTGRTWTGPQGGLWVELDSFVEKPGWLLVQGPGFGIPGPILQRVDPDEPPPMVLRVAKPVEIGSAHEEDRDLREILLGQGACVRDAKEWIALLFGLSDPRKIIVGKPDDRRSSVSVTGNSFHIKSCDGLLEDETSILDAGFGDGDELRYVYTGDLDLSFEGKEPSWTGKLGVAPKPKAKAKAAPAADAYPELQAHFEVLKLSPSVPRNSIKKHYRLMALECHPDKHPEDVEAATQRFQEVKAAYEAIREKLQL